jgi:hypothetical protein
MQVHALFGQMTGLVRRLNIARDALQDRANAVPANDPLQKELSDLEKRIDAIRKQIVATKEGGAITGEERLREHTDLLYGAIMSWEGHPTEYQLARIDVLRAQFEKISGEFAALLKSDLPRINDELTGRALPPIAVPETVTVAEETLRSSDVQAAIRALFALH